MLTTVRLTLAVGVLFLATATASAHGRHKYRYSMPMAPMMGYPMMAYPTLPAFPAFGAPAFGAPAFAGFGGGMAMSMQMSGDPTLMFGILRSIAGPLLGLTPARPATMTEAEVTALVQRLLLGAAGGGGRSMTADQANELIRLFRILIGPRGAETKTDGDKRVPEPKPDNTLSPEVLRARAEVQQMVAKAAARRDVRGTMDAQRARAEVQQMVAKAAARQDTRGMMDAQRARAEVQRMVAEAAARPVAKTPPARTALADRAK